MNGRRYASRDGGGRVASGTKTDAPGMEAVESCLERRPMPPGMEAVESRLERSPDSYRDAQGSSALYIKKLLSTVHHAHIVVAHHRI